MKKININYNKISNGWTIEYFLKKCGFNKTAEALWVQCYYNEEKGVEVNAFFEERKPETHETEWKAEILEAITEETTETAQEEQQTADNQTTEQAEDTAEQQAEEQAEPEEQTTEEQQQQPRKTKFYNPDWALKCVASDFGENAAEFLEMHPIERGCKSYLVEWEYYTIDGKQTESLYVSGVKDELTAKSIAIVATFGMCGKKLKYT